MRHLATSRSVHHAPQVIRLGRVAGLSNALLHLCLALIAHLGISLLQVASVFMVVSIEFVIIGM